MYLMTDSVKAIEQFSDGYLGIYKDSKLIGKVTATMLCKDVILIHFDSVASIIIEKYNSIPTEIFDVRKEKVQI